MSKKIMRFSDANFTSQDIVLADTNILLAMAGQANLYQKNQTAVLSKKIQDAKAKLIYSSESVREFTNVFSNRIFQNIGQAREEDRKALRKRNPKEYENVLDEVNLRVKDCMRKISKQDFILTTPVSYAYTDEELLRIMKTWKLHGPSDAAIVAIAKGLSIGHIATLDKDFAFSEAQDVEEDITVLIDEKGYDDLTRDT